MEYSQYSFITEAGWLSSLLLLPTAVSHSILSVSLSMTTMMHDVAEYACMMIALQMLTPQVMVAR
jgi:hypothetical protein